MAGRMVTEQEVLSAAQQMGRFFQGREIVERLGADTQSVTNHLRALSNRGALTRYLEQEYYWYGVGMRPEAALFHRVMMGMKPVGRAA